MNIYPTRATLHVAVAGCVMIGVAVATHRAAPAAFGGGILLAIALGRVLSLLSSTRLRQAGFEMAWNDEVRVLRVARDEVRKLPIELRNYGAERVRATGLRIMASSFLEVSVTPREIELPPSSSVVVEGTLAGTRVGRWGLHGLALELRGMPMGGEGLYEIPLVFASPLAVEVLPVALAVSLRSPRGGRSGRASEVGRSSRARGEGDELRELRDHVPSDPFKRIAWRASARRGRLMVREMERLERDVVWLLVDASVEGWAGAAGRSPLDRAIDEVAAVAVRHMAMGDQVGLGIFASRPRAWLPPDRGPAHTNAMVTALAGCSSMVDSDRCELDEMDLARLVAEHMRPLAREPLPEHPRADLDRLAALAERVRSGAPFEARLPFAPTPRERSLRHYLACFGVEVPPRTEGERAKAESELARTLTRLGAERPRPTIVSIWAPAPSHHGLVARALRLLRGRQTTVRWSLLGPVFDDASRADLATVASSAEEAVMLRARAEEARARKMLRSLGVQPGSRVGHAPPRAPRLVSAGREPDPVET